MDTELEAEQAYLDAAYDHLAWMRERALELAAGADPKELDLLHALRRRAASLTDGGRPLCFGRIDPTAGETLHIGRRHVEDPEGDPVVVEWRAPVAVPFYRATPDAPLGLTRRRQFVVDARRIESMADDVFDGRAMPRLRGGDALLAELERGRGAEMLDIVATIQAEQDEVIRAPLPGVLVVQGGPGSGKTAVGLHRAAFLLYGNDALARQGVLILGPNRVFLRYIAQVLPSLGEEAVVQTTVRDLAPGLRVVAVDAAVADRIKGDARMAAVLAAALRVGRRALEEDVVVPFGLRRVVLAATDANRLAADVATRRLAYEVGRSVLRDLLVDALAQRAGDPDPVGARQRIRAAPAVGTALDRLWPAVAPVTLIRTLLTNAAALRRAADGLLDDAEQRDLRLPPTATEPLEIRTAGMPLPAWELRAGKKPPPPKRREPWTVGDVALIDEATALITGDGRSYGHIVVDEAQDLTPMQLRMIARRAPGGSVTLLGDLAQASGAWTPERWDAIADHLARPDGWRLVELRLGYRLPADVIDLASRILPVAAPGVVAPEAVRSRRGGVEVRAVGHAQLAVAAAAAAGALAERYGSVALIGPASRMDELEDAASGLDAGRADIGGLGRPVALVEATEAKGLEFDAVVVADPAGIVAGAADEGRGLRLLYVALTRPTQALTVVHAGDLPAALAG